MPEMYDVSIKIISQKGNCEHGYKVGDEWVIKDDLTPGGLCLAAFNSISPEARVLSYGGSSPWSPDPDVTEVICPSRRNSIVFELRRLRK